MTTWIIIGIGALGLVASLYFSISQQMETAEELATVTSQLEEQTAKAEAAVTVLAGERAAMNDMARKLKALEGRENDLSEDLQAERRKREQAEQKYDEYEAWANSRLPDHAIRLLNESRLNPDNRTGAMQQRESTGDTSVAPDMERDDAEQPSAGTDRSVRSEADDSQRPDSSD